MLAGRAAVIQVNTDQNPQLAARFSVRGIPVLHLLQQGKSLDTLSGNQPAESIVAWFRSKVP
jgi:thioredoxin 2